MQTITREHITNLLKGKLGFSHLLCEEIVNTIFAEIIDLSLNNNKLTLANFGKFQVYNKSRRPGTNMQTRTAIEIKPRKVLRFSPAKSFKEKVNS